MSATLDNMLRRAGAALQAGDFSLAESLSREVLDRSPDHVHALSWLGIALGAQGRHADAESVFNRVVALQPGNAGMLLNLGNAQMESGALDRAAQNLERALALDPDNPEILNSLGCAWAGLGRHAQALVPFERALVLRPGYGEAHDNLGEALLQLGREEEAIGSFRKAVALQSGNPDFRCHLGSAFAAAHRWDEAVSSYEQALAIDPAFADARYNLAVARLFRHEFDRGWLDYERRLECAAFAANVRKDPSSLAIYEALPRWSGAGGGEHAVAIWSEQGLGDQVLFSTLLPELIAAAGAPLFYEIDPRLLPAYQRAFPQVRFVSLQDPPLPELREGRAVLLAGSLPRLFRRKLADFSRQPPALLQALPQRVADYRQRLAAMGKARVVGLSWRSTRTDYWGAQKNAPLACFEPLFRIAGTRFVDLQYGDTRGERHEAETGLGTPLVHFDGVDYFQDLEEVLAMLEACELLVTTSNVTAHLAGALGKRAWLLYLADRAPFHYWQHGGDGRSLWYPSVEILSAHDLSSWPALMKKVAGRLADELRTA